MDDQRVAEDVVVGGFRLALSANLHATLGARGYLTFVDSDTGLVCVSSEEDVRCLLQSSCSTFWEAVAGLSFRF